MKGFAYHVQSCRSKIRARCVSEGPACQVRCITLDYPFHSGGHDKRAPPILSLGGTCLSGPLHNVGLSISFRRARQACPSDFVPWRDLLVRSAA
jgi:hypothetical protein